MLTHYSILTQMYGITLQVEDNIRPEMRHTIEIYDPAMPDEAVTSAWDDTQRYVRQK